MTLATRPRSHRRPAILLRMMRLRHPPTATDVSHPTKPISATTIRKHLSSSIRNNAPSHGSQRSCPQHPYKAAHASELAQESRFKFNTRPHHIQPTAQNRHHDQKNRTITRQQTHPEKMPKNPHNHPQYSCRLSRQPPSPIPSSSLGDTTGHMASTRYKDKTRTRLQHRPA